MNRTIEVGRVVALNLYPVKSMRGSAERALALRWTGIAGDRQYAFCKSGDTTRFPWLTARDFSPLVLFRAHYMEPSNPRMSAVQVIAPEGTEYDIRSPDLLRRISAGSGSDGFLLQVGRGTFDSGPVSVIGTKTLAEVSDAVGRPLDMARFRQNIVIDGPRESEWFGQTLLFGDADDCPSLHVNEPIERCVMVTIDPATAERDPAVMRAVAQSFDNKIGAYGVAKRTGAIEVGDRVRILR